MSNNVYIELTEEIIADLKNKIDIFKSLLALSLPYVEEMASLTESPEDADLAIKIKKELNNE